MTNLIDDIKDMDHRFQRLTGREAFGYISHPTPTQTRVVFHDGSVKLSLDEAHAYMRALLGEAEAGTLRYPFDQELTPEQDLRVINGWGRPVASRLLKHGGEQE
jgi:hypothetical protein